MAGLVAILASLLSFVVPLAVPLFAQRWRTFLIILALAIAFFTWLILDLQRASLGDPSGSDNWIGAFLGGLMLFGFAAGAIAKCVMLVGRRAEPPQS